jgi:hypothetical protein
LKIADEANECVVRLKAVTGIEESSSNLFSVKRELFPGETIALVL